MSAYIKRKTDDDIEVRLVTSPLFVSPLPISESILYYPTTLLFIVPRFWRKLLDTHKVPSEISYVCLHASTRVAIVYLAYKDGVDSLETLNAKEWFELFCLADYLEDYIVIERCLVHLHNNIKLCVDLLAADLTNQSLRIVTIIFSDGELSRYLKHGSRE